MEQKQENMKPINNGNKPRDLRRLIRCKFNNGSIYLTEPVYRSFYKASIEDNSMDLYFNTALNLSIDPETVEWIDVTELTEARKGVFYNPAEFAVSGGYGLWGDRWNFLRSESMISFMPVSRGVSK